jgi:hypothetical protein
MQANCSQPWQVVAFGTCSKTFANQIYYGLEEAATEAEAIGLATLGFRKQYGFYPSAVEASKVDLEQMLGSWMKIQEFDGPNQVEFGGTGKSNMGYYNVNDRHMAYCLVQGDMDDLLPRISNVVPEVVKRQSFGANTRVEQIVSLVLSAFPTIPKWTRGDR